MGELHIAIYIAEPYGKKPDDGHNNNNNNNNNNLLFQRSTRVDIELVI
jgi:hypothetical protein